MGYLSMERTAVATIDLAALRHNFAMVKRYSPSSQVLAVIKANAYGHGLLPVAKALSVADGFAVACLAEARALRAVTDQRIVVLQGFQSPEELQIFSEHSIEAVVHQPWQIDTILNTALPRPVNLWLKFNTGMNRLGLNADSLSAINSLEECAQVDALHLMTHMACADDRSDDFTQQQLVEFEHLCAGIDLPRSIANSATLIAHADARVEWLRPGIMLYGVNPFLEGVGADLDLKSVMQLSTRLIAINDCQQGDMVGYGGHWVCPKDMRIGVAAIGYGDGYPRHAENGTPVLINGQLCPLVGRVSMDMVTVDLSVCEHVAIGDEVVLWGESLPVETIASHTGTIPYELLCNVYGRVNYHYINEEKNDAV